MVLQDQWELGYPDGPEMNEYKLQLQQFAGEWEQMQPALTFPHRVLQIGSKSPESLLQEMVQQMESECRASWSKPLHSLHHRKPLKVF